MRLVFVTQTTFSILANDINNAAECAGSELPRDNRQMGPRRSNWIMIGLSEMMHKALAPTCLLERSFHYGGLP